MNGDSSMDIRQELAQALLKRLESLLPIRTGHSLQEVEIDPQYIQIRNLLLAKVHQSLHMATVIILALTDVLKTINNEAHNVKLKHRDEKSRSSTILVFHVLVNVLKTNWNRLICSMSEYEMMEKFSNFTHYDRPQPLESERIPEILEFYITFLSSGMLKRSLALVRNEASELYSKELQIKKETQRDLDEYSALQAVEEIDSCIEVVFRYIAAANPDDYYEHLASKMFSEPDKNSIMSISLLQTYLPMVKFIFYTENNMLRMTSDVIHAISQIRSHTWKQMLFYFWAGGVRDQQLCRPEDFLLVHTNNINNSNSSSNNSSSSTINTNNYNSNNNNTNNINNNNTGNSRRNIELSSALDTLFNHILEVFDTGVTTSSCGWFVLATILGFNSNILASEKFANKFRLAQNKRLRFVLRLTAKEPAVDNNGNIGTIKVSNYIYHLGLRYHALGIKDHPTLLFTTQHLDDTHKLLIKFVDAHQFEALNADTGMQLENVISNFYSTAITLRPETYGNIVINHFRGSMDQLKVTKNFVNVLKELSEIQIAKSVFTQLVKDLVEILRQTIYGVLKIMHIYEMYRNDLEREQLRNKSFSELPVSSDNVLNAEKHLLATFEHKKTSLDHYLKSLQQQLKHVGDQDLASTTSTSTTSTSNTTNKQNTLNTLNTPNTPNTPNTTAAVTTLPNTVITTRKSFSHDAFAEHTKNYELVRDSEEILTNIFSIFVKVPELYFNDANLMSEDNIGKIPYAELLPAIISFCQSCVLPLRQALKEKCIVPNSKALFDAARLLSMQMVEPLNKIETECTTLSVFANFHTCNCIIQCLSESCLELPLTDTRFKSSFVFLNEFLHARDSYSHFVFENPILLDKSLRSLYESCGSVIQSVEKILLLSSCTHDAQFYNYAKQGMQWYIGEMHEYKDMYRESEISDNLLETFERMNHEDSVFIGFVSLQKRHRSILRDAKPTKSLFEVWLLIFYKWNKLLHDSKRLNESNMLFRHFTGFLVSTAGCFMSSNWSLDSTELSDLQKGYKEQINNFFDICINLLSSSNFVVRVIIKDTLSNESHSVVYDMITTKLTTQAISFLENRTHTVESNIFLEQTMMIMASMLNVGNDGATLLASMLPNKTPYFLEYTNTCDDPVDKLRLKLRFCKLCISLELDRTIAGLHGAYKLRNFFAKANTDWLEQATLEAEFEDSREPSTGQQSEASFLNIDLAIQSSKLLRMQFENLLLEIPDGILDCEVKKYKDLSFGKYFSIFYKIIQKYTAFPDKSKSKHKFQQVVENILTAITNILQYDSQIGIQYLLPMGYHEDQKIRAIFIDVFAGMLSSLLIRKEPEEFPDSLVCLLTQQTEIFCAVAQCATSLEHNLLASSLYSVFAYTHNLEGLFKELLCDEISNLTRASDLFRRNSTLTRLLFNITQEYGQNYLNKTICPIVKEIVDTEVYFEVEKRETTEDSAKFIHFFEQTVQLITDSLEELPEAFKYVCHVISETVSAKFENAALSAVGSFLFLRFICPAVISPEQFFKIPVENPKTKRSLMQIVKVLQNIANGTLGSIHWPGLVDQQESLNSLRVKITDFLAKVSKANISTTPFMQTPSSKPIPELRYMHKFIYHNFVAIGSRFLQGKSPMKQMPFHKRVEIYKVYDDIVMKMGQPKPGVKLQLNAGLRLLDTSGGADEEDLKFNDFMTKLSLQYASNPPEATNIIHSAIFEDGTPVIVVNFRKLRIRSNDIRYLVFKLLETASQVWDNKFYLIYDFSEFHFADANGPPEYTHYVLTYAGKQLFENCKRVYYFNMPRTEYVSIIDSMKALRKRGADFGTELYFYSSVDAQPIVNNMCLDLETVSISSDCKVTYKSVLLFEPTTKRYVPIHLKIGRKFLTCFFQERVSFKSILSTMNGFNPVEVYRLVDLERCEITDFTDYNDEFTIFFDNSTDLTLRSPDRLEILRFLYFTTSRLPKDVKTNEIEEDYRSEVHEMHWFGRLYNIVFQGLLSADPSVKKSSSILFGSLSSYFGIKFGATDKHAKTMTFPADATDLVVEVSTHLALQYPEMSFRFLKAYFDNFEKMEQGARLSSILYISPWINNIYDHIYARIEFNGPDRVGDLIRHFCRITALNQEHVPFFNDYIWKKLFLETRLVPTLIEEVVAFAIDSKNVGPRWSFIISVITPSIEVCGAVMAKLKSLVKYTVTTDSSIALQSKLFEISVLLKICSSLFFNSYILARLYFADIIFLVTLFIDSIYLEVGSDLQSLIISSTQSFLHTPRLSQEQLNVIDLTIEFFSSPRAKMLFGMTRDSKSAMDVSQTFNRIANFEILCEYLNGFIDAVSTSDDRSQWKARWASNSIDVAFNNHSLFQDRAVLITGILAKRGITDSLACRAIKTISRGQLQTIDIVICISVALSRMMNGLLSSSILPPLILWPQLCFAFMNYSILYQTAVQNIVTSVTKMMCADMDYMILAFEKRQFLEPYLSDFEKRHDFAISNENGGIYILSLIIQGLKLSHFRHMSLSCLKIYFSKRYESRKMQQIDGSTIRTNANSHLLFFWLASSSEDFELFMEELQIACQYDQVDKTLRIPDFLHNFLLQDNEASTVTMLCLGQFLADPKGVDIGFKERFISLYFTILSENANLALLIYHKIQPTLTLWLVYSSSVSEVERITQILLTVSNIANYDDGKYRRKSEEIILQKRLNIIKSISSMKPVESSLDEEGNFTPDFEKDIQSIQIMFYRAACTYVEGYKLED